jgi:hypothetical protein
MLLLNQFWPYSDSWHVAVNSNVKHTNGMGMPDMALHDMDMLDVGVHDMGVHSMDMHRMGEHNMGMMHGHGSAWRR